MRARKSGTIVSISSATGQMAVATNGLYNASKHALEAVSEALALEVAEFNVRVLIVEPGSFRTNFLGQGALSVDPFGPDYKGTTVEKIFDVFKEYDGRQGGDPSKAAAERIVETVMKEGMAKGKKEFLRLPFGADCVRSVRAKIDLLSETMNEFEEIASRTGVDG